MEQSIPAYKGYIFDLDGTLINSSRDIAGALNRTRLALGLKALTEETVLPMIGNGLPKLVERGFADTSIPCNNELIEKVKKSYLDNPCSNTLIYPGVVEALKALVPSPLAIISNKPSQLMAPTLEALKLKHFFDVAVGGDDFPDKKPHPAAALHILERWALPAESVLMVGDMIPDRDLARNAGMPFAFCRYGFLENPLDADHQLDSLMELTS